MLTAERLRALLVYAPDTGVFTWKIAPGKRTDLIGRAAGKISDGGYRVICVDYQLHGAHRLAWLYMTGTWPSVEVDHKNRVRSDNRFDNLRDATHQQNVFNQSLRSNSTSAETGVSWCRATQKWRAHITRDGKFISLGRFADKGAAIAARRDGEQVQFGEFARAA